MTLENPPTLASELTSHPVTSWRRFARDLHDGRIEQNCIVSDVDAFSAKSKKEVEERTLRRAELGLTEVESLIRGLA
ncbi:hypothetical protein PF003_g10319 [Phytophthora fragariae]|nr:hypothetical protein PF003_g10319 [Phytophthora fragariae]